MTKKILILFITLVVLLAIAAPSLLGFSLWNLGHAVNVSTSMSAKLACSARYLTGLSEPQILIDLASYSPAVDLVTLTYDDDQKRVSANLFGLAQTSAQYRQGIGCSLVMRNSAKLDQIKVNEQVLKNSIQEWPVGNNTPHIDSRLQTLLENIVTIDNTQGLNTRAMLVIKDGQLIAESYDKNISNTTPLLGWSMGKSLTAIMLGRMQKMGMLTMSQANLFSQWQGDERNKITLMQLLQMSSGLAFDETYAPGSDATHMLFTAVSASSVAMVSPLTKEPGSYHAYSSGTTNLLSRYIHQQLGHSTQADVDFLFKEIFTPLSMNQSIFETDSSGVFVGSSYVYSSGQDWARLGLLMLNNGRVGQQQLLPEDWVKAAVKPNQSENDRRYGFQFWLNADENTDKKTLRWSTLPTDAYAMMGNRKQSVMIIPSENVVLVRLGWTKQDYPMESNYRQLLDHLSKY